MLTSSSENSKHGCALNLSHDSHVGSLRRSARLAGSSQFDDFGTFPEPAATKQSVSEICSGGAQVSVGAAISSLETTSSLFETPKAQRVLKRACDFDATSPLRLSCAVLSSETHRGLKRAFDNEASPSVQIRPLVLSPAISDVDHSCSVVVINDSDSDSGFHGTACPSGAALSVLETFDASSGSVSLTTAGQHVAMLGASSIESSGVSLESCSSLVTAVSVNQTVSPDAASCGSGPRRSSRIAARSIARSID